MAINMMKEKRYPSDALTTTFGCTALHTQKLNVAVQLKMMPKVPLPVGSGSAPPPPTAFLWTPMVLCEARQ